MDENKGGNASIRLAGRMLCNDRKCILCRISAISSGSMALPTKPGVLLVPRFNPRLLFLGWLRHPVRFYRTPRRSLGTRLEFGHLIEVALRAEERRGRDARRSTRLRRWKADRRRKREMSAGVSPVCSGCKPGRRGWKPRVWHRRRSSRDGQTEREAKACRESILHGTSTRFVLKSQGGAERRKTRSGTASAHRC